MGRDGGISLVGRTSEQAALGRLVEQALSGLSGVLVVRGEAGIGKTSLLDAVASSATGFDVVRLVGIESEMRLGFAALHQLLAPFLDDIDSLPPPQARALSAAFGISDDVVPDQFLVGLAALTLVSAVAATRRPLLIVIDDTQWLDQESADALGFLARRLHADPVCLLASVRDSNASRDLFEGLPLLNLSPLSETASVVLLDAAVRKPLANHVRARLLAEARGNPLALVEFGRELSPDQLAGVAPLPEPLAVDRRFELHFLRQVGALPASTQRFLLVAAAGPTRLWRTRATQGVTLTGERGTAPPLPNPLMTRSPQSSRRPRTERDGGGAAREQMVDSVSMMLDAARAFEPLDVRLARDAAFDVIQMAIYFGDLSAVSTVEAAQVARSFKLPAGTAPQAADLGLDAIAELLAEGYSSAREMLHNALTAVQHDPEVRGLPRHLARACWIAFALSDDDAVHELGSACAETSREQGAFRVLPEGLDYLGVRELRVGSLHAAENYFTEVIGIHEVLRRQNGPGEPCKLMVSAWRGREADVRAQAAELASQAPPLGIVAIWTDYAVMTLELGLGNYQAASSLARGAWNQDVMFGGLRAADAVEAHVRSGNRDAALAAVAHLTERAAATQSGLDLGLLGRSQALLASDTTAEDHFSDSIARLEAYGAEVHLARSQLVYGEWLRRQKRRRDARAQLEAARDIFVAAGANGFAERARVELLATGARARKRVDETRLDLTPQEWQISRLVAAGATNSEIGERLFISANTVDYHLRKVYRKLGIKTRYELARVVSAD